MKKNQTALASIANAQSAAAQVAQQAVGQSAVPDPGLPDPGPRSFIPSGAIVLFSPVIELSAHIFVGTEQTKRLKPECAYIYDGVIVIEELKLILPMAGNYVRTT